VKDLNWGLMPPSISHSKDTHFQHEVILHGSMTTHAMLHGDHNNMQLEVPNHLQTFFFYCTPMMTRRQVPC
jgi:hypothetical protein